MVRPVPAEACTATVSVLAEEIAALRPMLVSFARKHIAESHVEDVVQEAIMRAIQNMHTFRGESDLNTWVTKILLNAIRAYGRKKYFSDHHPSKDVSDAYDFVDDRFEEPDVEIARQEIYDLLVELLQQDEILRLSILEECPLQELADRMGTSVNSIKSRLYRARLALREVLRKRHQMSMEDECFDDAGCT